MPTPSYGTTSLSADQRALFGAYPVLRRVTSLLRIAVRQAAAYTPTGKQTMAQLLEAAALAAGVAQEEALAGGGALYPTITIGVLAAQCQSLAAALRATAYTGSGDQEVALTSAARAALAAFSVDILLLPQQPTDLFAVTYLPQAGQSPRVDLLAALGVVLDGATF